MSVTVAWLAANPQLSEEVGLVGLGRVLELIGTAVVPLVAAAFLASVIGASEGRSSLPEVLGALLGGFLAFGTTFTCARAGRRLARGEARGIRTARHFASWGVSPVVLMLLAACGAPDSKSAGLVVWFALVGFSFPAVVYVLAGRRRARALEHENAPLEARDRGLSAMAALMLCLGAIGLAVDLLFVAIVLATGAAVFVTGGVLLAAVLLLAVGRSVVHIAAALVGLSGRSIAAFRRVAQAYFWVGLATSFGVAALIGLRSTSFASARARGAA